MRKIILVTLKSTLLMKKIFTLLVLMCSLGAMAQEYTPLVREGVKWNCVMRMFNARESERNYHNYYSIQIKGDTLINETHYKKCYYIFDDKDEPSNVIPRAFLREDIENQQVFMLFNDKYSTEKGTGNLPYTNPYIEHLLYDFKQRDNASQYWINMGPTDYASTEIIDKLMLEGTEKEIYRLSLFASYGMRIGNFELVEGIGLCRNIWLTYNHSYPGDLLMPHPGVYGSGDNFLPVFLNFEDAEGNIVYVAQEYNGIESVASTDKDAVEATRYDLYGRRLSQPAQGVNIVKMSDGTTRKEMVK